LVLDEGIDVLGVRHRPKYGSSHSSFAESSCEGQPSFPGSGSAGRAGGADSGAARVPV